MTFSMNPKDMKSETKDFAKKISTNSGLSALIAAIIYALASNIIPANGEKTSTDIRQDFQIKAVEKDQVRFETTQKEIRDELKKIGDLTTQMDAKLNTLVFEGKSNE